MRNRIVVLLMVVFASMRLMAQVPVNNLELKWELVTNQYQGRGAFLAALTISNSGKTPVASSGWKLYFNSIRDVTTVAAGAVKVELLSGGLHRLTPLSGFPVLQPGGSYTIQYEGAGRAFSKSDAPQGFYLVMDAAPEKGWPITKLSVNANPQTLTSENHLTPEAIYLKNEAWATAAPAGVPKIFPEPLVYREGTGFFELNAATAVKADPAFSREAAYLEQELRKITLAGKKKPVVQQVIALERKQELVAEAYELNVTEQGIVVKAADGAGIFYGIQSLKSLMPMEVWKKPVTSVKIPAVSVEDAPRFGYRSFMLDVARNFQSKEEVLRILELISFYKLNTLHFHLNDDEGWRLEIPGLPELTETGAVRGHTTSNQHWLQPSFGSGPDTSNAYGTGFYSRQDFLDILKFATERHIRVIPEVETPGHARAAVKSMDARYRKLMAQGKSTAAVEYLLRDTNDLSVYTSVQGWSDNVMNVALPSTYRFLEKVADEIIAMYKEAGAPLSTIHFGGDEVPAGVWEKSPAVTALMKKETELRTVDDLWYYYFGKVNAMLQKKGLYLSGWEEIALRKTRLDGVSKFIPNPGFVNENFHAYVWNNVWGWGSEDLAYRLANAGYKVVLAPVTNFYFDLAYQKSVNEPGLYWGGYTDIDKSFGFAPYNYYKSARENLNGAPLDKTVFVGKDRLTEFGKQNIVGIQCLIWSEMIRGPEQLEYMLLPKLLGFAQRAWSAGKWETEQDSTKAMAIYKNDWSRFLLTIGTREIPRLHWYNNGYHFRVPAPGAIVENGIFKANTQIPGMEIRFTTDGTEPTLKSPLYTQPIQVKNTVRLKVFSGTKASLTTQVNME